MTRPVLYVDDLPQLPDRMDEILTQAGFELVYVADPEEALRIACKDPLALVLIEVLLPGYDGFELIRKLNSARTAPSLPIVVVTRGERTPELYGQALEFGVAEFICKPVVEAQILEAVLEFALAEGQQAPAAAAAAPTVEFFEGDLAEQPLAGLLGRLHRVGASGVLELRTASDTCGIQFRNGSPVEVEKHRYSDSVADYLRRTKRIDAEQYEMLVDQLMARIAGPREILIGMEALTEEDLLAAEHEQGRVVLLEMFEWAFGGFSFQPGERLEGRDTLEVGHGPTNLLLAGLKRTPDALIRAALDRRAHLYPSFAGATENPLEALGLPKAQHAKVESLMGDRTVAEVLASKTLDSRTLYGLCSMDAVRLDEIAVLVLDDELKLEESAEIRSLPERHSPTGSLPERRPEVDCIADADVPGAIESRIDEIAKHLDSRDDFELFGIDEASADSEVRAAYDALLAALRLDGIPGEFEELETRVRGLRRNLDQAYQRVRTADTRRLFGGLRKKKKRKKEDEPQSNQDERETGSRAVEAETWFRTGEGFLKHEEYAQASEAFGMALHLDPQQGDYSAYLGYAMYRSNPDNSIIRREALEHVAKGVKVAPDAEKPLLFLSRIFRETGETEMAIKVLRRALRANPDSPALVQEMCLAEPGSSQSKRKKIFDRFRRR
jgi:CheY-like chemotaxis protein